MEVWYPFDEGRSIGQRGSEGGVILCDEEHSDGSRITLESGGHAPFAITCGIYGWMVHTCFFRIKEEAQQAYEQMKTDLVRILNLIPLVSEMDEDKMRRVEEVISEFIERFP